jgi:hypothetical protein
MAARRDAPHRVSPRRCRCRAGSGRGSGAWVLRFGKGTIGTKHTPVFAAGSADVTHGLLGAIQPAR